MPETKKMTIVREGFPREHTSVEITLTGNYLMVEKIAETIHDHARKEHTDWKVEYK